MSTFQKRHYEAIAEAVRDTHPNDSPAGVALNLADLFQRDSDRFDRDRFLAAATPPPVHEELLAPSFTPQI